MYIHAVLTKTRTVKVRFTCKLSEALMSDQSDQSVQSSPELKSTPLKSQGQETTSQSIDPSSNRPEEYSPVLS